MPRHCVQLPLPPIDRLIARLRPDQRRNQAVGRRDDAGVDVELVAVGLGVELERDPVAAIVELRGKLDQGPARANVGLAAQTCRCAPAR